jgi:hypothetical protein
MNNMKSFKTYVEEKVNEIIVLFGHFNPPHIGHEENIGAIAKIAQNRPFKIYAPQSEDPESNPLSYKEKIDFMRKMFPKYGRNIIFDDSVKHVFDVAVYAHDEGYTRLTLLVGSDCVSEFKAALQKYDGVKGDHGYYKFADGINVRSDSDSNNRTDNIGFKVSESQMISVAVENDFQTFSKGLPKTFGNAKELFNAVRRGMGLEESHNFRTHIQLDTVNETRERYIAGEIFNVGERVL